MDRRLIAEGVDPHHAASGGDDAIDFSREEQHVDHHHHIEGIVAERQNRSVAPDPRCQLARCVPQHLSCEVACNQ